MFKTYYNYKKIDIPSDDFYLNWLFFCMGKVFMDICTQKKTINKLFVLNTILVLSLLL